MVLVALAGFVGASLQSATGVGFALVLGPALFAAVDPHQALSGLLIGSVLMSVLMLGRSAGSLRRRELALVLAGSLPGLVLGVIVLDALSKPALQIAVGVAVIVAVTLRSATGRAEASRPGAPSGVALGFVAGTLTTSTNVNGPPLALWMERQGFSHEELRATIAGAFLGLNAAGLGVFVLAAGSDDLISLEDLAVVVGAVLAGHLLGSRAFSRLGERGRRVALLTLVLASGVASLVAGLTGL